MPDLTEIKKLLNSPRLEVQFSNDQGSMNISFSALSDGEKCFMICALVLAANETYDPLLCFWDEPDNYLALSEVGHFVLALRQAFQSGGQFIATSHNAEAIRCFSDENTLVLDRKSHLEPTIVGPLEEAGIRRRPCRCSRSGRHWALNKYLPHVFVLPGDRANREIAIGFRLALDPSSAARIQVLAEVGGWNASWRDSNRATHPR